MLKKVKATLKKYSMLKAGDFVTVALSGGADSVCLLHILNALSQELGFRLSAAHLNHNLRGAESDRDEQFVKELCDKLCVPLTVGSADVSLAAKDRSESIELAARNVRYEFLKENARGLVATAHTASDNLETVIYNATRGSGTRGLGGIPPVRDIFIRPLIECTRDEVEEYLSKNGLSYVTDSTNLSDEYNRNFIRHNIVPALKKINPSVEKTVAAGSQSLREDADFIDMMAVKIYSIISKGDHLDATLLSEQHPAVAKRVLSLLYKENIERSPDSLHINEMHRIINGGKTDLAGGYSAVCDGKTYKIIRNKEVKSPRYDCELEYGNVYNLFLKNTVDYDKIKGQLTVRTRQEGDFIRLSGRGCTKSLKKLMNELKIPLHLRDSLPVAADDEGVVFVHSIGVAERVAPDKNTKKTVTFKVTEIK